MTRLALTRKAGETVIIHKDGDPLCTIKYVKTTGHNQIRMSFDAPPNIQIDRQEIYDKKFPADNN